MRISEFEGGKRKTPFKHHLGEVRQPIDPQGQMVRHGSVKHPRVENLALVFRPDCEMRVAVLPTEIGPAKNLPINQRTVSSQAYAAAADPAKRK